MRACTLPDWIDPQQWADFEEMRKQRRKPLTDPGRRRILKIAEAMRKRGIDVNAALDRSITNSWLSIYDHPDLPRLRLPEPEDANRVVSFTRAEAREALKNVATRGINPRIVRTP